MARIHILSPETARLIAAGEVIERPASALRELIDNALDAGASEIRVELEGGGIDLVRVSDDGCGMSREDLSLALLPHATSKISCADDLLTARTLGFRGEALASIAAVSRIEVSSVEEGAELGWRLRREGGLDLVQPQAGRRGSVVAARSFFENFPARRQFLKRPQSEAALCRAVFEEKAAAFPGVSFVWASGARPERLPASGRLERIAALHPELPARALRFYAAEIPPEAGGGRFEVVYADPSCHRRDRKYLQVFVNGRKVPEWGLAGVLEYAFSDYLPGGMRPVAFLFCGIEPSRADFNIHPAKREVRIKRLEELKSAFLAGFRARLRQELGAGPTDMAPGISAPDLPGFAGRGDWSAGCRPPAEDTRFDPAVWERPSEEKKAEGAEEDVGGGKAGSGGAPPFRYLGRAFGPFLLFEKDEALYILDQHAAHERILFDQLSEGPGSSQSLLVPIVLDCPEGPSRIRLSEALPDLERMGYSLQLSEGSLSLEAVPSLLGEKAAQALADSFFSAEGQEELPGLGLLATMACRAAVKDGDELDPAAARDLVGRALGLPLPRCPHGRPIWVRLDRQSLYRMVGRSTQ